MFGCIFPVPLVINNYFVTTVLRPQTLTLMFFTLFFEILLNNIVSWFLTVISVVNLMNGIKHTCLEYAILQPHKKTAKRNEDESEMVRHCLLSPFSCFIVALIFLNVYKDPFSVIQEHIYRIKELGI